MSSCGCCCRYFYQSFWLKIHYYRTVKKTLKKLSNNVAKQSQTYANLHSMEYVFVFTLDTLL